MIQWIIVLMCVIMEMNGGATMPDNKNSAAKIRANNKYAAKAYDRINLAVPKGRKATVEEMARQQGGSINALVNALLCREAGLSMEEWKNGGE